MNPDKDDSLALAAMADKIFARMEMLSSRNNCSSGDVTSETVFEVHRKIREARPVKDISVLLGGISTVGAVPLFDTVPAPLEFDFGQVVSVELTDVGMEIAQGEIGVEFPWDDLDLYHKRLRCRLVSLMRIFGPYLYDGSSSVFESVLRVEVGHG